MNSDSAEKLEQEPIVQATAPPKRSYSKREKKVPTIASLNDEIEAKKLQIETIQAEIEVLTAQRNSLFFNESEMMGLINLMADPESAMWLARKVEESNSKQNQ